MRRKLCIIFEAITPVNAIGKIAVAQVHAALEDNWQVSVVAKDLCPSLVNHVEWRRLFVPPRGFALQWLTARTFIKQALVDKQHFDVIHGHQPQIASLCDIFQCHFITRAAHERACLLDRHGLRRLVEWAQKRIVLSAEDFFYRNWNPKTLMLFNSQLTRETFKCYYGSPPREELLLYPSPPWSPSDENEREQSRGSWGLPKRGLVLGFLGGLHERKGYRRVIQALRNAPDIHLLFGGLHSEGYMPPEFAGRFHNAGLVRDLNRFYAACDMIVLASHFEPFGYVASEAAARGVPTIASKDVGALPHLLEYGAGVAWNEDADLASIVRLVATNGSKFHEGCRRYTEQLGRVSHNERLCRMYRSIADHRS